MFVIATSPGQIFPKSVRFLVSHLDRRGTDSDRSRIDNDRMTSLCHEVSAGLAAFAHRQRVAQVVYDDAVRSFADSFPWAKLKTMLAQKLRAKGIDLIDGNSSGPATKKRRSPLEKKEKAEVQ